MSVLTQAEKDLAALKAYLVKAWGSIEHGFDTVEEAVEEAVTQGHELITNAEADAKKVESDLGIDTDKKVSEANATASTSTLAESDVTKSSTANQ